MKKVLIIMLASLMFLLSGCSLTMSVDELMRPPRLTEEQENIYNALIESTGNSSVKLKYPRGGNYKSAFIMYDIDSDDVDEAIVFYDTVLSGAAASETTVNISILDTDNGKWKSVANYQYSCSDIDLIDFIRNENGNINIAIGYITGLSEKVLNVYGYTEENQLEQKYETQYTKLYICDTNSDNADELMVFNNNAVSRTSQMTVVTSGNPYDEVQTIEMSPDISEIAGVVSERLGGRFIVYIDELRMSNTLTTEIMAFENGEAFNLTYEPEKGQLIDTQRKNGIFSSDVDSDGNIEVPCASVLPGYENEQKENQKNAIQWLTLSGNKLIRKHYSYYNINEGYLFIYPERWVGFVTVRTDSETGETVFAKYEGSEISDMKELMRIKVSPAGVNLTADYQGYQFISSDAEHDFYIKLSDSTDETLVLTSTEASFSLYTIKQ